MYYIYLITNRLTSKIYVGQAVDANARWNGHLTMARSYFRDPSPYEERERRIQYVEKMMSIEGIDNFIFTPIQTYPDLYTVSKAETWWIDFFPSLYPQGYNMSRGGGKSQLPEIRSKMSAARRKLSNQDAITIVQMWQTSQYTHEQLAEQFNVNRRTIGHILDGSGYSNITGIITTPEERANRRDQHTQKGSEHNTSKLTNEQVLTIVSLYESQTITMNQLATQFNISYSTVSHILYGYTWNHLTKITPKTKEEKENFKQERQQKKKEKQSNIIQRRQERIASGILSSSAKLIPEQVIEIVDLIKTGNYSHREVAKMFGASTSAISAIIKGDSWSHLTGIQMTEEERKMYREQKIEKGEDRYNAKFTAEQVLKIVELYNTGDHSYGSLSALLNARKSTISSILSGRSWSHLTGIIPKSKRTKDDGSE
jgi:group I intron endonuclease